MQRRRRHSLIAHIEVRGRNVLARNVFYIEGTCASTSLLSGVLAADRAGFERSS